MIALYSFTYTVCLWLSLFKENRKKTWFDISIVRFYKFHSCVVSILYSIIHPQVSHSPSAFTFATLFIFLFHKHLIDNLSSRYDYFNIQKQLFLVIALKTSISNKNFNYLFLFFGFLSKRFFNMSYSIFILCKFNSKYCE